jgi:hypothetical protein
MRGDRIIQTQLLMAQGFNAISELIEQSSGYLFFPTLFADLPITPIAGMVFCIGDSPVNAWGDLVTVGGAGFVVLIFYDGANWKVIG